jgi:hypothetical protein
MPRLLLLFLGLLLSVAGKSQTVTEWDMGFRGVKSLTVSFKKNDSIVFSLSRERARRASFAYLVNSGSWNNQKFDGKYIVAGTFNVAADGVYLFRVKNRSLLGNKFTLTLEKIVDEIPPAKGDQADDKKVSTSTSKPKDVYTMVTRIDSTVFLACTSDLKRIHDFTFPTGITTGFNAQIVKVPNIEIQTKNERPIDNWKLKSTETPVMDVPKDGHCLVYLYKSEIKHHVDSLVATMPINSFSPVTGGTKSILIRNNDRVVGKWVRVQLVEIQKIAPTIATQ